MVRKMIKKNPLTENKTVNSNLHGFQQIICISPFQKMMEKCRLVDSLQRDMHEITQKTIYACYLLNE